MPLDQKQVLFDNFQPSFARVASPIRKRIEKFFVLIDDALEALCYMLYLHHMAENHIVQRVNIAVLPETIKQSIGKNILVKKASPIQIQDAVDLMRAYSKIIFSVIKYKNELNLPHVSADPCYWLPEFLRLTTVWNIRDYPLLKEHAHFVVALLDTKGNTGDYITVKWFDYFLFAIKGKFDLWYAKAFGYGLFNAFKKTFKDIYIEELKDLSDTELQKTVMTPFNANFVFVERASRS